MKHEYDKCGSYDVFGTSRCPACPSVKHPELDTDSKGEILTDEAEEALMRRTLLKCFTQNVLGFRVSAEHYRYLAEHAVAWRKHAEALRKQLQEDQAKAESVYNLLSSKFEYPRSNAEVAVLQTLFQIASTKAGGK